MSVDNSTKINNFVIAQQGLIRPFHITWFILTQTYFFWSSKMSCWSKCLVWTSVRECCWKYFSCPHYHSCKQITQIDIYGVLTLKMPRKPASENVVCLCHLLNILANFSNLFLHTGKQCRPWEEQLDLGPHRLQKWPLKSQADDKADDNFCDRHFKG